MNPLLTSIIAPARAAPPGRRCRIEPLRSNEQLRELVAAANQDRHPVIGPTHVAIKAGRVVGYMGVIPSVQVWVDTHQVKALDSLRLLREAEAVLRRAGIRRYVMPCAEHSPFYPHMERLGFTRLGFTSLNLKDT